MEQIYSQRVNELTPQPIHDYLKIWLGDSTDDTYLLTTEPPRPNFFQSFELTRLDGVGCSVTFTLFDDNWDEIEFKLSQAYKSITVQYGHYHKGNYKISPPYKLMLTSYSISFVSTGVLLSVSALADSAIHNLQTRTVTTESYNPTEAVKLICGSVPEWVVKPENFHASQDVVRDNPYNMNNEHPATYIQQVIIPEAQMNGEIFHFWVDDTRTPAEPHFELIQSESIIESQLDTMKTYIYQKGYDSVVLDMSFDINGLFGGTTQFELTGTPTWLQGSTIGTSDKRQETVHENIDSVVTYATGPYRHTSASQSLKIVGTAGYSPEQVNNRLYYALKNPASAHLYQAQMTIVGDPTIKMLELVRIINITDDGNLHHTSGIYQVMGISDSLSGGQLTTSLKLVKNGDISEGIELMNYRKLIK